MKFCLRFPESGVPELAGRYSDDDTVVLDAGLRARQQGFYDEAGFLAVCRWKSPRRLSLCAKNGPIFIEDATRIALTTQHERLRLSALTSLQGIEYPRASALLHLAYPAPNPILDFRALAAIGISQPSGYSFDCWWSYVEFCHALAVSTGVDMHTLDRALWHFG